jgi:trehalose 6-phosphate synthase
MSEEDREQAAAGLAEVAMEDVKYQFRYLAFDEDLYDAYYNGISNRILWFLHHYLWDVPRQPQFGSDLKDLWASYRRVNEAFALALHEEGGALDEAPAYLVQDYHLSLVPALLRDQEPDATISYFSHIPFAGPGYLRILPTAIREELMGGVLGADIVGFHAPAWAENFLLGCRLLRGTHVDLERRLVEWRDRTVRVGIYPISVDAEDLDASAGADDVQEATDRITEWTGDKKLLLRVDRADLSKNILRGFLAYERFLIERPEWRRKVLFLALLTPSREEVPEYQAYMDECVEAANRINKELSGEGWTPIRIIVEDDFPLTLAGYQMYDALLVNAVFDGMNLVAKEGPLLNQRDGVLILSENAGAFAEIGRDALALNPFDVEATARAIATSLEMEQPERGRRAAALRDQIEAGRPEQWIRNQLDDLDRARPRS